MAIGNLAPIIPAIFTGPNGERLTADQIKRRQEIAESLMAQATDTSPNAGGWASIAAKGLAGFQAGRERRSADNASSVNAAASQKNMTGLLSGLLGGSPAATAAPAMGGLPAAASTGVGAEMAATAPGVVPPIDMSGNELYSSFIDTVRQGGLTNPYGLAAVAATGKAESGWSPQNATRTWSDPSESGKPGTAGGIMSWRGPRYQALAATGDLSPQGQAKFFLQEDPNLIAKLNNARSLEEAQSAINQAWAFAGYDRPGGEAARRLSYAQSYLPTFQGQGEVAALTPQGAIEAVAPAAGGQPPAFDAGRFGDPINLAEMPPSASTLPSSLIDQGSSYAPAPPMTTPPREVGSMRVAEALAAQPATSAPATAPAMVAPPQMASSTLPPINPAVIETLSSSYASPEEKAVAQALLGDYQQKQAAVEKQAQAEQQRQMEIQRRQQIAQQTGIDPVYAQDDALWEGSIGNKFAAPSTSTVNGVVIDNRTGQSIYEAPADAQTYRGYAEYEQSQGRTPLGPLEYEQALRRSGASQTNVDTGTIPTGFQAVRDAEGRLVRYDPVPGGPADMSSKTAAAQEGRERSGGIVLEDVDRAVAAIEENPTLTTGLIGEWTRGIAGTPAKKVFNLLQTVRANAAFDKLQQMRDASPTGGALGGVAIEELNLLKNAIGSLEQSNDSEDLVYNLRRVQKIYEDIIHGPEAAAQMREQRKAQSSSSQQQQENPLPPQTNGRKTSTGATWEVLD